MRPLIFTIACAALTACGASSSTSTPVTDQTYMLTPLSSAWWKMNAGGNEVMTFGVFDFPDFCTLQRQCGQWPPSNRLWVGMNSWQPGTFTISPRPAGIAGADFLAGDNFDDPANTGSVTVDQLDDTATLEYDLAMKSGAHLVGAIVAQHCTLLEQPLNCPK
jgi:hypothetical protein